MRMRVPGFTCFSTTSVGELKNTMESLSALSTSATASASTPSAAPISEKRRCLRVIVVLGPLAFKTKSSEKVIKPSQLDRIAGECTPRIDDGGTRLLRLAEHEVRANEPQPPLDVGAIAMQPLGEPFDHAFDHRPALLGAKLGGRRNLLVARVATRTTRCAGARASGSDASERASQHIDPRRIGWRGLEQRAPSRGGLAVVTVLLGSKPEEVLRLDAVRIERDRPFKCSLRLRGHYSVGAEHQRLAQRRFAAKY